VAEARVPGDHRSMLDEPHAAALARALRAALRGAGAFTPLAAEP
jgi:thioesterase domain-containing protein